MTTASVLLTVSTTWRSSGDKHEKEEQGRVLRNISDPIEAIAARELRESPSTKEQALYILRNWIQQNNDVRNIRQDDSFLLRFLRQKKYSVPMAQQTLLKYLSLRKYYPEIFLNLDSEDTKVEEILNKGYVVVSPVRDCRGRRVIVYSMGRFDATRFSCWDMCRVHALVYEALLEDPVDQVCGFTHVGDGSGVTGAHITVWNPSDFARVIKWGEQSMPMRHKEFHLINIPAAIKYVIDFALSRVTPKMAERLRIHTNIKQLHKHMDVVCLPTTYGGEIPLQDMINFTKQLLCNQRKKILSLNKMEILNTRGIISSRTKFNNTKDHHSIEGSFRKLEID